MSDLRGIWSRVANEIVILVRQEIAGRKLVRLSKRHRGVDDATFGKVCLRCGVAAPCPPLATSVRRFKGEFGDWEKVS